MKLKDIFPKYAVKWLAVILTWNCTSYAAARLISKNRYHYDLSIWLDKDIPFLPWTVSVYLGCYVFWTLSYLTILKEDEAYAKKFAFSEMLGKTICFIIYIIFPTTMQRGDINGNSIFDTILGFVYATDAADNLFPSIHCFISWLCYLELNKIERLPKWIKITAMVIAFMVFASTLTVKQHVIADVISGFLLAEITYSIFNRKFIKKSK